MIAKSDLSPHKQIPTIEAPKRLAYVKINNINLHGRCDLECVTLGAHLLVSTLHHHLAA